MAAPFTTVAGAEIEVAPRSLELRIVIVPPVPLSRTFPEESVIAIVKVPQLLLVVLGFVNLLYVNVRFDVLSLEPVVFRSKVVC